MSHQDATDAPRGDRAGNDRHHVHQVPVLPPQERSGTHRLVHGWAAGLDRTGEPTTDWTFFEHLEPAVVFGRAARMSSDVTGWTVHEAALRTRPLDGRQERTLFVGPVWSGVEDGDQQAAALHRWLAGCNQHAAAWVPPVPKPLLRRTGPRDRRAASR